VKLGASADFTKAFAEAVGALFLGAGAAVGGAAETLLSPLAVTAECSAQTNLQPPYLWIRLPLKDAFGRLALILGLLNATQQVVQIRLQPCGESSATRMNWLLPTRAGAPNR
jgi:hypothetical protein